MTEIMSSKQSYCSDLGDLSDIYSAASNTRVFCERQKVWIKNRTALKTLNVCGEGAAKALNASFQRCCSSGATCMTKRRFGGLIWDHVGASDRYCGESWNASIYISSAGVYLLKRDTLQWFGEKKKRQHVICEASYVWVTSRLNADVETVEWSQRWPGSTCANIQRSAGSGRRPDVAMDEKLPGSWIKSRTSWNGLVVTGLNAPQQIHE